MELNLFTDLIDAIGKVAAGLRKIANFPKNERDKYRKTMDETYRLLDTALNMVIIRLGDILQPKKDNEFISGYIPQLKNDNDLKSEIVDLSNYDGWLKVEREFRLCKSLRATLRETESLRTSLSGKLSTKDWDSLLEQMRAVLSAEYELAEFISQQFKELADSVRDVAPDPQLLDIAKKQVTAFRDALIQEREQLLKQEVELYEIV